MGSYEIQEWIAELGTLRPEDEEVARKEAEREAKGFQKRL